MDRIKTLLHVHTDYSYDSNISLDTLARFVDAEGFGCVAVTDHDTIEGALRFRSMTDARVIVGEEVTTSEGHLIGLFLHKHIRPGMTARDTARAIRAQDGLVLLPHPFVKILGCALQDTAHGIVEWIDAVEINNAQNFLKRPDRAARHFADRLGFPGFAGADCHMATSIAPCYQFMRSFDGPADFLEALQSATLTTGRHPLSFFMATGYRLIRYFLGLSLGGDFGTNVSREPITVPATPAVAVARI